MTGSEWVKGSERILSCLKAVTGRDGSNVWSSQENDTCHLYLNGVRARGRGGNVKTMEELEEENHLRNLYKFIDAVRVF